MSHFLIAHTEIRRKNQNVQSDESTDEYSKTDLIAYIHTLEIHLDKWETHCHNHFNNRILKIITIISDSLLVK